MIMKNTLYKYFPLINDKGLERVIECIRGKIYFSNPITFNDPFELQTIVSPPNMDEIHTFLSEAGKPIDNETKSYKYKLNQSIQTEFLRSPPTITTQKWLSEIGILCLTESAKNLLMWAHYGSNHKGICIGFNALEKPFSTAKKIIYTENRPQIPFNSYKNMLQEDAEKIFLHKSKEWEYENEWRCVKRTIKKGEKDYYRKLIKSNPEAFEEVAELLTEQGGPGNYEFDQMAISRIYLGCRTQNRHKEVILREVQNSNIYPKIFQLKLDPRYFHLTEDRIKK